MGVCPPGVADSSAMKADRLDLDLRHAYGVLSIIEELYEAGRIRDSEVLERLNLLFVSQCWRNVSLVPLSTQATDIRGYIIQKKSGWVRGACGKYLVNVYDIYSSLNEPTYYSCDESGDYLEYRSEDYPGHDPFNGEIWIWNTEWVGIAVTGRSGNNLYGYAMINSKEGKRIFNLKPSKPVKMEGWKGIVTPLESNYTLYAVLPRDEAYLVKRWVDTYWKVRDAGINQLSRAGRACVRCWTEAKESLTSLLRDFGVAQIAPEEIAYMEAMIDWEPFLGIPYGFELGSITLIMKIGRKIQVTAILRIVDPTKEPALDISLSDADVSLQDGWVDP